MEQDVVMRAVIKLILILIFHISGENVMETFSFSQKPFKIALPPISLIKTTAFCNFYSTRFFIKEFHPI